MPRPPAPSPRSLLPLAEKLFGIRTYRGLQEPCIDAVLRGRDSLLVESTGLGKSLCYQLPALAGGGLTLVISPLIALMEDQVESLRGCGEVAMSRGGAVTSPNHQITKSPNLPVAFIAGDDYMHPRRQAEVLDQVRQRRIRLFYCSPERAMQPAMIAACSAGRLTRIVVDEAHCISHWGHDFRPAYADLSQLRRCFPDAPIHAFTATATQAVREEIVQSLGLVDPCVLVGDFDRPNLQLEIVDRDDTGAHEPALAMVQHLLAHFGPSKGIVYCPTIVETERIADVLSAAGLAAQSYHSKVGPSARRATQQWFAEDSTDTRIVSATIAFGMGINVRAVRWVLHVVCPSSLDGWHQEIGRAGRDGKDSRCLILYAARDFEYWQSRLLDASDEMWAGRPHDRDYVAQRLEMLEQADAFCGEHHCRHAALCAYFDQAHPGNCGACDVCCSSIPRSLDPSIPSSAEQRV